MLQTNRHQTSYCSFGSTRLIHSTHVRWPPLKLLRSTAAFYCQRCYESDGKMGVNSICLQPDVSLAPDSKRLKQLLIPYHTWHHERLLKTTLIAANMTFNSKFIHFGITKRHISYCIFKHICKLCDLTAVWFCSLYCIQLIKICHCYSAMHS